MNPNLVHSNLSDFRIIHLNIRGVQSNKQNLEHYLAENSYPEIVTLNETMLRTGKNIKINGYYCASRREPNGLSGKHGSMILVRETLQDVVELDFLRTQFQEEVIGIEILGKDGRTRLSIVTYYNPPGNRINPGIFCNSLYRNTNTIIMGDLNCKHKIWGSSQTDALGSQLADTLDDHGWVLLNDGSKTRIDPRSGKEEVLDVIVCKPDILKLNPKFSVGDCIGSDHLPLHCTLSLADHRQKDPNGPIFFRNVSQIDETRFKELVNKEIRTMPEIFETARDLESVAMLLPILLKSAFEASCPLKRKHKNNPVVSPLILALIKEKRKLRRLKSEANLRGDSAAVQHYQQTMNKVGNDIKKEQKKEQKTRHEAACKKLADENNPYEFFRSIKKLTSPSENTAPCTKVITDELGNTARTAQERINLFANRLERVHQTPEYEGFDENWKISVEEYIAQNEYAFKTDNDIKYEESEEGDASPLVAPPTVEEVLEHLRKCKTRSAAGLDGVGYALLKKAPPSYHAYIAKFFGACLRIGYFPKAWKHAKVIMIPKPNKDTSSAKNYRPISLLSCLGKLFERLLAGRLSKYLEKKGLFNKNQSGYRRGKMTSDHLLRLVEESHEGFRKGHVTASLFLDAEAAFDKCWHNGIKYKLKKVLKLPQRLVRALSSFLTDRTLQVDELGLSSKVVNLGAGTPQGSCLSPLLYIISVNDLPTGESRGTSQYQFADDIAVCGTANDEINAIRKVQKAVDDIEGWCRRWRVKLNGDKSNLVILSRKRKKPDEHLGLLLFNDVVRPVSEAKFLGVEIDSSLRFKDHIQTLALKAEKRLNMLKILAWGGTDPKILLRLYKIYIRSIFEYGAVSFIHCPDSTINVMQKIQNKAIRISLKLPRYVSVKMLHESSCLPTIKERILELGRNTLARMRTNNPLIRAMANKREALIIRTIREKGLTSVNRSHRSPLDILLPVQQ